MEITVPSEYFNSTQAEQSRKSRLQAVNTDVESASGAALYARDSLSFAGSGKLVVGRYINNAVATTDHLIVLGGELELVAVNNGLKGKDSVTILDGRITIHSGNDGIKSNNDVDADCGNIDICGGEINIVSLGDGIQAEKNLSVENGIITISAGDTEAIGSGKSLQSFENLPDDMRNGMEDDSILQAGETPPDKPDSTEQNGFPGNGGGMGFPGSQGGMNPQGGEMPPEILKGTQPQVRGGHMERGTDNQTDPSGDMRGQGGMQGDFSDMLDREWSYGSDSEASTKGLKSGGNLIVSGGSKAIKEC